MARGRASAEKEQRGRERDALIRMRGVRWCMDGYMQAYGGRGALRQWEAGGRSAVRCEARRHASEVGAKRVG